jgi:polysaccharide export outer membrane protein
MGAMIAGAVMASLMAGAVALAQTPTETQAEPAAPGWRVETTGAVLPLPSSWTHAHRTPAEDFALPHLALRDPDGLIVEPLAFAELEATFGTGASAAQITPALATVASVQGQRLQGVAQVEPALNGEIQAALPAVALLAPMELDQPRAVTAPYAIDMAEFILTQASPPTPPASWSAPPQEPGPTLTEATPPPELQQLNRPPVEPASQPPALPPTPTSTPTPASTPASTPALTTAPTLQTGPQVEQPTPAPTQASAPAPQPQPQVEQPAPPQAPQPYFETRIDPTETRTSGVPASVPPTAAQASTPPPIVSAPLTPLTPPAVGARNPTRDVYALGPLDRIKLIVFQEPDLSGEFAVQSTGRIALPLVGDLQAQGLTARELEQAIITELRSRQFLNDPKVAVEVLSARPFYILGEVQKPGEYPYQAGLSALNAIATAGGFTPLADQTSIMIKRAGEADWKPHALEGALQLGPGDTVRVEKGAFYILGEVQKAGEYPFTPGMSVLRAVATAQGYTARAERGRVLITRRGETAQRELPMRPDVPIQPGDTIIIPERWF